MSFDADRAQRFFFVHIMKTGGGSLRRRLIHHFGKVAVYPTIGLDGTDLEKANVSIDYLRERLAVRGDQIRVITGHFALRTTELIEEPLTTLTLLREPVDRMLSLLRQRRRIQPSARDKTLEEDYESMHGLGDNNMTKMLSLTPAELGATLFEGFGVNRGHLERAKEALVGIDAVGLQERFDEFCAALTARFGWDLGAPVTGVNATPAVEVSESFRARIAEDNSFDVELYEFAKRLIDDKRDREQAPGTPGEGQR
jgi:hypothetical protein